MTATAATEAIVSMTPPVVDKASRPLTATDPTLGDVRRALRILQKATRQELGGDGDPETCTERALGNVQAVLWQCEFILAKLHEPVQDAPPQALNELVMSVSDACPWGPCSERMYPWSNDCCGYCSDECCQQAQLHEGSTR